MTRFALVFVLAVAATSASAANWPWQEAPEERLDYCKGFVVGGLASTQVAGNQRTDLWLAWNYIIRSAGVDDADATGDYQEGRAQFASSVDATAARTMIEQADGSCGLGRSGHQVTGW